MREKLPIATPLMVNGKCTVGEPRGRAAIELALVEPRAGVKVMWSIREEAPEALTI